MILDTGNADISKKNDKERHIIQQRKTYSTHSLETFHKIKYERKRKSILEPYAMVVTNS